MMQLNRIRSIYETYRMRRQVRKGNPVQFSFRGRKYWVNPDGAALFHIQNSISKIADMADLIPFDAKVIFDVGGNCGLFSAFAELSAPGAIIHCFEPSSNLLPIISKNTSTKRVKVHNVAVGDSNGQLEFFVNKSSEQTNSANESAVRLFAEKSCIERVMVNCITLEQFSSNKGIASIDVLKVDVQGYEGAVFRGCGDLISTVKMLFVESTWMDIESIVELVPFALESGFTHLSVLNPVYMGADILLSRHEVVSPAIKLTFPIKKEILKRRWRRA